VSDTLDASVQAFVARQPGLAWRRRLLRSLIRFGMRVLARVTITGEELVPASGPVLVIMNHLTLLDPVLVMGAQTQRFVVPMSKVENARNPLTAPFVWWWGAFTVRRGEVDRQALLIPVALLRAGQMIAISPEGTRNPTGLKRPKDGVVYIASKANTVIIPIAVSGTVGWQKTVLLLRRPRMTVNFGPPFRLKTDGRARIPRDELQAMSEEIMYQLSAALTDPGLRGSYADLSKATTRYIEFVDPATGEPYPAAPTEQPVQEGVSARSD
jgi:1-acyl-sn-glycerol-3-phosphate acyltransferase